MPARPSSTARTAAAVDPDAAAVDPQVEPEQLAAKEADALLADLDAQEKREESLAPAAVDIRSKAIRRFMRERDHLEECPAITEPDKARVEAYDQTIPVTAAPKAHGGPGDVCTVARCLECGGYRLLPGTTTENLRKVAADAKAATT